MYNGEIISYNINEHPVLNQVLDMLDKAFLKIPDNTNLIFHSDQGWQYQHQQYQKCLKKKGFVRACPERGTVLIILLWRTFWITQI